MNLGKILLSLKLIIEKKCQLCKNIYIIIFFIIRWLYNNNKQLS